MHSLFPASGELSKTTGQPNSCSKSQEGEWWFIFKYGFPCLVPCYLLQWGSSFRRSRGKISPTKLNPSPFTCKWHKIFFVSNSSLGPDKASAGSPGLASQCLVKMPWAGSKQVVGQILAQGSGVCLNPDVSTDEHSESTPHLVASDLTGLSQVAKQRDHTKESVTAVIFPPEAEQAPNSPRGLARDKGRCCSSTASAEHFRGKAGCSVDCSFPCCQCQCLMQGLISPGDGRC